jgi:RHS repeat-associated protein
MLLAMLATGAQQVAAAPSIYYLHNDHLGAPRVVTDHLRDVKWRADYKPFGETIFHSEQIEMPLRFPGQYYDSESGLHYNYYRDYDPTLGRYVQSDPIGLEGGLNTFVYGLNNPLSRIDFFGLRNQGDGRRASGSRSSAEGQSSVFEKCQMDVAIASTLATAGTVGLIVRGYGFAAAATSTLTGPFFALANAVCPRGPESKISGTHEQDDPDEECED